MQIKWSTVRFLVLTLFGFVFSTHLALADSSGQKPLILGVFPRVNAVETNRMFQPLAHYLAEVTQHPVILETSKDFDTFWQGVIQKRYDIVHYTPYQYLKSHKYQGYQVILKNIEKGHDTIANAIVVRTDSNIHSIADLKGKKIIYGGDKESSNIFVFAMYMLQKAGLKKGDFEEEYSKNPPNAVLATFFHQADAAITGNVVLSLPTVTKQIDVSQLKYLAVSDPLPHLPWAVKGDMAPALKLKIQHAMLNLNKTPQGIVILKKIAFDGFAIATDAEYDKHRQIIKEVLGEDY